MPLLDEREIAANIAELDREIERRRAAGETNGWVAHLENGKRRLANGQYYKLGATQEDLENLRHRRQELATERAMPSDEVAERIRQRVEANPDPVSRLWSRFQDLKPAPKPKPEPFRPAKDLEEWAMA